MQRKKKPFKFARTGKPRSNGKPAVSACLEPLEQRVLFSADVLGLDPSNQLGQIEPETTDELVSLVGDITRTDNNDLELIFIDSRIQQRELIVNDLLDQKVNGRNLDVIIIESNQHGLNTITQSVASFENVSAVHILSHGTSEGIQLGNMWLNNTNVEFYISDLVSWKNSLTDSADLLIYGCNLAGSEDGLRLLDALEQSTQADIAASSDLTGHENLGANWTLEHASGPIDTQALVTDDARSAWTHEMAAILAKDDNLLTRPVNTNFTLGDSIDADENIIINDESTGPISIINISDQPDNGTLTQIGQNTYEYAPNNAQTNSDSFEYVAADDPDILHQWLIEDGNSVVAVDETSRKNGLNFGNQQFNGDDFVVVEELEYPDSFTLSFDFQFSDTAPPGNQGFYEQGEFGSFSAATFSDYPPAPEPGTIAIFSARGDFLNVYDFATQIRGLSDAAPSEVTWNIPFNYFYADQWYNYTLTVDNSNPGAPESKLYINGYQVGDAVALGAGGFNLPANGATVTDTYIGGSYRDQLDEFGDLLSGDKIRDVRIYDGVKQPSTTGNAPHPSINYDTATVNIDLQPNIGPDITLTNDPEITEPESATSPSIPISYPIEVNATDDVTVTISTKDNLAPNLQNGTLQVPNTNTSVALTVTSPNELTLKGPAIEVNKELALLTYTPPENYHNEDPLIDMVQDDLLTIKVDVELVEAVDKDSGVQFDENYYPLTNDELFRTDPTLGDIITLNTHGEHIAINDFSGLQPEEITVAAWVNLTDKNNTAEIISFRNVAGIRVDSNGHLQGYANYNGVEETTNHELAAYDLVGAGWHHVAYRIVDGHQQLYLDGVRVGESYSNLPLDYNSADNRVVIGKHPYTAPTSASGFVGEIDDAFVFARALHIAEIEKLSLAQDTSVGVTDEVPIRISPTNNAPSISGLYTGTTFNENQTNYVLLESSGLIEVDDVEANIRGSYDGYSITLQRDNITWYANETAPPNAANTPNITDHFDATNGLIDSANGVVLDSDGTFGTIDQNSGGVLKVTFEDTSSSVPVTKDRINTFLNSITYFNNDVAPPESAEISWIFEDNGHDNFGNTPSANSAVTGFSTVNFNRDNSNPVLVNNNPVTAYFTSSNIIAQTDLLTRDDDHVADDLRYRLMTLPQHGRLELTDGTAPTINDDFSQADINSGVIAYVANPGTVDVSDEFLFSVSDGPYASVFNQTLTINVTSDPNNQTPTISYNGTPVIFTEDGPPVAILGSANIQDADSTTLQSVTITLNNGTVNDTLTLPSQTSGITGTFTAGVLALSKVGTPATMAEYEAAISSITFENSNQNPTVSNPTRSVSIVLDDGNSSSAPVTRDITVTPVNDAPVIANISGSTPQPVFTENGPGVNITDSLSIFDIDDDNIEQAYIEISSNFTANDELYLPPDPVNYPNISSFFNGTSTPNPGLLTLSGTASKSEYAAAIHSVEFINTSDNPDLTDRTVSIYINDGDNDSITLSRTIAVVGTNDAPELLNVEPPSTPATYTENSTPVNITTTSTVNDKDDTQIEFARILLTNYAPGDTLVLDPSVSLSTGINPTLSVTASQIELLLENAASLANYQTAIQAVTFENGTHAPTDTTRTVTIILNDGDAPSAPVTRNIEVTPVNDAPTIAGIEPATSFTENGAPVDLTDTVTVSDVDDIQIEKAVIKITNNELGEDLLNFSGHLGITGQFIASTGEMTLTGPASTTAFETAIGRVSYVNNSELPNTATRTISIEVFDSDPATPSNSLTRDIEIIEVPDIPEINGLDSQPAVYIENGLAVPIFSAATTSDLDDTDLVSAKVTIVNFVPGQDTLHYAAPAGITGNFDSTSGELEFTGTSTKANYDAALQSIEYSNNSNNPSTTDRVVSVTVTDTTGELSGAAQRLIEIHAVDDNPVISGIGADISFTENAGAVPITTSIAVNDIDNLDIDSAIIKIDNYVADEDELLFVSQNGITGVLNSNNEFVLSGTTSLANYQAAIQSVLYNNTSNNPDTTTRTISISVTNDLGSNTETKDIEIYPINDPPTLAMSLTEASAAAYTENLTPARLTNTIIVDDVDNAQLSSATITLINSQSGDQLLYTPANNIEGSFDSTTNTLALTGVSSPANYQAAIRSVTFESTSDIPTNATRGVSIVVSDSNIDSNTVSRDIEVTPTNDAPVVSNIETNVEQYDENSPPVIITDNVVITDIEDDQIVAARISVNNAHTDDQILFTDQNGISGNYNNATKTLILTGNASTTDYQTAIRSITFANNSDDPSINERDITIEVSDGDDSNSIARKITVNAINDAPIITNLETSTPATFTEGDAPTPITTMLDLSDLDNTNLASTVISIVNFAFGEDELLFTNANGISGNFDNSNGVLTLSGSASAADYQAAIRAVAYTNTNEDPGSATRTISIEVDDGIDKSIVATRDIDIIPVNDAPTLNPVTGTTAYHTEDLAPTFFTGPVSLADIDNTILQSATITLTNNVDGEDVLRFSDQGAITHTFNTITGDLELSGAGTLTEYATAIESVRYENTSQDPTTGIRNIAISVNDGTATSNIGTREIAVQAVDDAPVITALETQAVTYTENLAAQTITDAIALSDVDNINLTSATVTIDGMVAGDQLAYTTQSNIVGNYNNTSGILQLTGSATPNEYASAIQSVLFHSTSENPTSAPRNLLIEVSDGLNLTFDSRELIVTPVNDAPTGQNNTLSTDDTDSYSFRLIDFPFTDIENDSMSGIVIDTLPGSGILTLVNHPVAVGNIISKTQLESGDLIFTPDENSGVTQTTFTYSTKDTGGTAINGVDTDIEPNTITIEIGQINDLPVPSAESINVDEDGTQDTTVSGAGSLLDNAFDADADTLTIEVTAEPQFGILTMDENTGAFSYKHNGSENHTDQFTYSLTDGIATVAQTVDIIVSPTNDAPTANTENFAPQTATFASPFGVELPISNFNDVDGDILTFTARVDDGTPQGADLPTWLSFSVDTATGTLIFDGSPTTDEPLNIIVIASDAVSSASTAFQLTINPATEPQMAAATQQEEPESQASATEPDSDVMDEGTVEANEPISFTEEIADEEPAVQTPIEVLEELALYDNTSTNSDNNDLLITAKLVEQHSNFQLKTLTDSSNLLLVQENTPLADLFYTDEESELLKKTNLARKLDDEREVLDNILSIDTRTIGGAVSVSTGLSIGYVIWLVRGGLLLGSVMSALPAWRNIDPLPVLSTLTDGSEEDDDSLEEMVAHSPEDLTPDKSDSNNEPAADKGQES